MLIQVCLLLGKNRAGWTIPSRATPASKAHLLLTATILMAFKEHTVLTEHESQVCLNVHINIGLYIHTSTHCDESYTSNKKMWELWPPYLAGAVQGINSAISKCPVWNIASPNRSMTHPPPTLINLGKSCDVLAFSQKWHKRGANRLWLNDFTACKMWVRDVSAVLGYAHKFDSQTVM